MRDRLSLRARLLAVSLLLVAAGLTAAGLATHHYLDRFLLERLDQQLVSARGPATGALMDGVGARRGPRGGRPAGDDLPSGSIVEARDGSGQVLASVHVEDDGVTAAASPLPADLEVGFSTRTSAGTDDAYRVLVGPFPARSGPRRADAAVMLVVAVPLQDVEATLGRLRRIELAVGVVVLLTVGLLAWWLVRLGLQPLVRIEETAAAIAANAPLTIATAKFVFGEIFKDPDARDLDECARRVKACFASGDYREGRRAFMEKRKPAFAGR